MLKGTQITLEDVSDEYRQFVDKFKPKKTTDDCYTPENVYETVLDWCVEEYGIDRNNIVRPFWPGGDYEQHEYPEGCTVVDNPPFSMISRIARHYSDNNIKYFLFAPYLTNFSTQTGDITHIITDTSIQYENGAVVNTAFITNLDEYEIRTAPELSRRIREADKVNRKKDKKELPKYRYPVYVVTATMMGYLSKYGIDFKVRRQDCAFIRQLESQKAYGKTLFGSGYLLSEKAAAEKAVAEKAVAEKAAAEKAVAEKAAAEKAAAEKAAAEKAAAEKAVAEKAAAEKAVAEKAAAHVWELSEHEKLLIQSLGR